MVTLIVELETEGLPMEWEVGAFPSREDAEGAAAIIEKETAQAADAGEDVAWIGFRTEAVGGAA